MFSFRSGASALAVAATVALCYFGALGNGFTYDDQDLITGNEYLKGWMAGAPDPAGREVNPVWKMITTDFAGLAMRFGVEGQNPPINYYRPVIAVSYLVDTCFWGRAPTWGVDAPADRMALDWDLNPVGFHLTNLLFHVVNSLLVLHLVRHLVRRYWAGLGAALIFAAYPIHTESVTWIAGRTDVMATTFFLAAFWGYVLFRQRGSRAALWISMVLFTLGMFAKEMVATLPGILVLYEGVRVLEARRRGEGVDWFRRLGPALAFFLLVMPYFLIKAALASGVSPHLAGEDPWRGVEFVTLLATLPGAFAWYLEKLALPLDLNVYPMLAFTDPGAVLSWLPFLLLHTALLAVSVWGYFHLQRGRWLWFFGLGLYLALQPLNCLVPGLRLARFAVDIEFPVSERFLYIPSFFVAAALGVGLAWLAGILSGRGRILAGGLVGLGVLASAWITCHRNQDWEGNLTLFRSAVRSSPEGIRMRLNYGAALTYDEWETGEGRRHLEYGVELARKAGYGNPPAEFFTNLAANNYRRGELEYAARDRRMGTNLKGGIAGGGPGLGCDLAKTLLVYGTILANPAYVREAHDLFQKVLQLDPRDPEAGNGLGNTRHVLQVWRQYFVSGDRTDALVQAFARTFDVLAFFMEKEPDPLIRLQALQVLDAGLSRLPGPEVLETLPESRKIQTFMVDRVRRLRKDLSGHFAGLLDRFPDRPGLQFLLGEVNRMAGRWLEDAALVDRARALLQSVLTREPDHAAAARGLADILLRLGQPEAARDRIRHAVTALLREDRIWEGRPLKPEATRAVDLVHRVAADLAHPVLKPLIQETWPRALAVLERRAAELEGGRSWEAWNRLGILEGRASRALGRQDLAGKAVRHFREALRIRPDAEPVLVNLLEMLRRTGRHEETGDLERRLQALRHSRSGGGGMPTRHPIR